MIVAMGDLEVISYLPNHAYAGVHAHLKSLAASL